LPKKLKESKNTKQTQSKNIKKTNPKLTTKQIKKNMTILKNQKRK